MPFSLYLLALAVFVMGTSEFMLAGLISAMATDLDVTIGVAGLLASAFAVGMVAGAPLMAAFARRWPPRVALLVFLCAFAGCHAIGAMTSAFPVLLVTRTVSALASAGFLAVALSTATSLVPGDRKGRALSVLLSGTTIATVAGVPAGALLGDMAGWRATFWAIAILCVPAALGVVSSIPSRPLGSARGARPPALRDELRLLLVSPQLILMMTLGALINGGTFAALTFLAPLVTENAGLADAWVPVVLVMFGIGSFLGAAVGPALGAIALAIGGEPIAPVWVACALVAIALAIMALSRAALTAVVTATG